MAGIRNSILILVCGALLPVSILAQEFMVFPNEGQSAEQQQEDEFFCYGWSRDQSGFDPMAPPTATQPPPQESSSSGSVGKGLVAGAAVGAVAGSSSRDTRKGALAGATVGGMRRADQKQKDKQARQQWEQEQAAIYQESRNRYNRAYAACMEGKNYTVR